MGAPVGRQPKTNRRGIAAPAKFTKCRFEAKLHEAKFLPSGEMRVIFLIPDYDGDEAVKLKDAFPCALEVGVRKASFG